MPRFSNPDAAPADRSSYPILLAALFLIAALFDNGARAESAAARDERFNDLVESLNASSERRARTLELVYGELRGPNGREMQELLRESLFRSNILILQGAAEALTMHGDANDVTALEALLATSDRMEVKSLILRLLPAFCLAGAERARFNYIRYAAGYDRVPPPGVLEPLRRPPLTRRGRFDPARERLDSRIARSVVSQFDPVGAALSYIDDRLYSQAARRAILHYAGDTLGNDPGRWSGIWATQGRNREYAVPEEVEELRLNALQALSDMGAEGSSEIIDGLQRLLDQDSFLLQAVFETMAVMCGIAWEKYPTLRDVEFDGANQAAAEGWRRLHFTATRSLAIFASAAARERLERGSDNAAFAAAAACLGSALSPPPTFPDPDGLLAAESVAGQTLLERLLLTPDVSREKRSAVALALGNIGTERAVAAIGGIVNSPYCSPEFGSDGLRMAETAVDSLRIAATGEHAGRDAARRILLELLVDPRVYPPPRKESPPVGLAHIVLWRLQRLAKSNDSALDPELWRERLGW